MARGEYNTKLPKRIIFFKSAEGVYYGPYMKKPTAVYRDMEGEWLYFNLTEDQDYLRELVESDKVMTPDDADILYYKKEAEGFWYCFNGYSKWEDVDDPKFHQLRKRMVEAGKALDAYIKEKYEEYVEAGKI